MNAKTYISQSELGRRIGCAPATIAKRIREREVQPDGVLVQGGKEDCLLFDVTNLPELRQKLAHRPVEGIA